ncbi:MAG: hypothetical protein AAFY33_09515, partial [Cyanobacteria bacterium J06643_4]
MTSLQVNKPETISASIALDTWLPIPWERFALLIEQPAYEKNKAYYHNGQMRIESLPTGSDHAKAHSILVVLIGLLAMVE